MSESFMTGVIAVIALVGVAGIVGSTGLALYRGTLDAGGGRRQAAALAAGSVTLIGGWAVVSATIAAHGGYRTRLGAQPPWLPIAAAGEAVALLALARLSAVRRALSGPGALRRLSWPHAFRVAGIGFVLSMLIGDLPALFALPAGLGDMAVGLAEPFVARRLAAGGGRRWLVRLNLVGLADLILALVLGGLTSYRIVAVAPAESSLPGFPLALVPTVGVPLLFVLHLLTLRRLGVTNRGLTARSAGASDAALTRS